MPTNVRNMSAKLLAETSDSDDEAMSHTRVDEALQESASRTGGEAMSHTATREAAAGSERQPEAMTAEELAAEDAALRQRAREREAFWEEFGPMPLLPPQREPMSHPDSEAAEDEALAHGHQPACS